MPNTLMVHRQSPEVEPRKVPSSYKLCTRNTRKLNNHINRIHERALRLVYKDRNSMFEEILTKDGSFKFHDSNFQRLLIEISKVKMTLVPEILNEVFDIIESPYPLRNKLRFKS